MCLLCSVSGVDGLHVSNDSVAILSPVYQPFHSLAINGFVANQYLSHPLSIHFGVGIMLTVLHTILPAAMCVCVLRSFHIQFTCRRKPPQPTLTQKNRLINNETDLLICFCPRFHSCYTSLGGLLVVGRGRCERNVMLKSISTVRDANPRNALENTAKAQPRYSESIFGKCTPGDVVSIRWKAFVAFPQDGPQRARKWCTYANGFAVSMVQGSFKGG